MEPWVFQLFSYVQLALDALLWGIGAYAIFIALIRNDPYWQIGAWIAAALFLGWKIVWVTLAEAGDIRFPVETSESIAGLVADICLSVGLAFLGFVIGRWLVKKAAAGLAWSNRQRAAQVSAEPPPRPRP